MSAGDIQPGGWTKGPWNKVRRAGEGAEIWSQNEPSDILVAVVQDGPDELANTCLIAAATDMAEALQYARDNLGDPVPVGRRHVARRIDAALAKARGES